MPNGLIMESWDDSTNYSKIYHVTQSHPLASNENLGTLARPWNVANIGISVFDSDSIKWGEGNFEFPLEINFQDGLLVFKSSKALPLFNNLPKVDTDLLGNKNRDNQVTCGPFNTIFSDKATFDLAKFYLNKY